MSEEERVYLTASQVRMRFGGISDMTLWRWLADAKMNFPRPLQINRRRFFRLDDIERWEGNRGARGHDAEPSNMEAA